MKADNIFDNIPDQLPRESIQALATSHGVEITRILSKGHQSPEGFWYDQNWDEWVLLIQGSAGLEVAHQEAVIELQPGDHLMIPAGVRHRVAWTAPHETTIWLAIHVNRPPDAP